jgi:hypothetical protein
MRHHHTDNQLHQAELAERRARVDNETSSPMHPPRTIEEQVEELDDSGDDHRRRDPLGAAQSQQEPREDVSGGGPAELENEGSNEQSDAD